MHWLQTYYKEQDNDKKSDKAKIRQEMLDNRKNLNLIEMQKEYNILKKKLKELEKEIEAHK